MQHPHMCALFSMQCSLVTIFPCACASPEKYGLVHETTRSAGFLKEEMEILPLHSTSTQPFTTVTLMFISCLTAETVVNTFHFLSHMCSYDIYSVAIAYILDPPLVLVDGTSVSPAQVDRAMWMGIHDACS